MFDELRLDLLELKCRFGGNRVKLALTNRGLHALMTYRIAHWLYQHRCRILSELLTRAIQIIYSIDIDYRCTIAGGVVIVHGVGLVIGQGVYVARGTVLYHQVTLGIRGTPWHDGFPSIGIGCTLGAGSKLLGPIRIGDGSVIAANAVVTRDIPAWSLVTNHGELVIKSILTKETAPHVV